MFRCFLPDLFIDSVLELTPERLKELGLTHLLLDVDCTLKSYKEQEVSSEICAWIKKIKDSNVDLCLLSNGLGARISRIARQLAIPYVASAMKPSRRGCCRAMTENRFDPRQTAIVGDQLFSDIWAGRRAGIMTIRVIPIRPNEEPWFARYKRPLEHLLLSWSQVQKDPNEVKKDGSGKTE